MQKPSETTIIFVFEITWGKKMAIQMDVSDSAMAAAIEANFLDAIRGFDRLSNVHIRDSPQMLWLDTPDVPYALVNGVLRSSLTAASIDSEIDRVTRRFRTLEVPALWWVWPSSQPHDLAARLTAYGWQLTENMPGMAIDLQQLPGEMRGIEGFEIVRVADDDLLRQWIDVVAIGFELSEKMAHLFYEYFTDTGFAEGATWQNYMGLLDGQPVACLSLFFGAGVAGIYNVATLPEARGKGIGTVITRQALVQASARGYQAAILGSSEMGYRVYQRLGFKEYFKVGQYFYAPEE